MTPPFAAPAHVSTEHMLLLMTVTMTPCETELLALLSLRSVCLSLCSSKPLCTNNSLACAGGWKHIFIFTPISPTLKLLLYYYLPPSRACVRWEKNDVHASTIISIAAFIAGASTISRQHARKTLDSFAPIGGANAADKSVAAAAAADDEARVPRAAGNALCSLPDPTLDETLTLGAPSVITRRGLCLLSQLRIWIWSVRNFISFV